MAGETILIAEDNDVLRQGLQVLLQSEGYKVIAASNGVDALQKLETEIPDLILSDIAMPQMDGYAFFEQVRSRAEWVSIPFVFLTARRGKEDLFASRRLGAEDYLVKPVTRKELVTTIRSRLVRSQQLLIVQLQRAYKDTLMMLANTIELRDVYTRKHVENVSDFARIIAQHMGFNDTQLQHLEYGSILHDIGKIYIPKSVLGKEGPLNDAEWIEMRKHPQKGAELIKDIDYLYPAVEIIRCHHERWNGSGYPGGLIGEQIPLGARIVAVADSLDAMCSRRSYQPAVTSRDAYIEIVRNGGVLYDPGIVSAFERAWSEIEPILLKKQAI